jgi:hypothetical protein
MDHTYNVRAGAPANGKVHTTAEGDRVALVDEPAVLDEAQLAGVRVEQRAKAVTWSGL